MSSTQKAHFGHEYVFDFEQGLNFAFAFTAYDSETENILDPSYGRITFNRYAWGIREDNEFFVTIEEIPSHTCTEKELGLG